MIFAGESVSDTDTDGWTLDKLVSDTGHGRLHHTRVSAAPWVVHFSLFTPRRRAVSPLASLPLPLQVAERSRWMCQTMFARAQCELPATMPRWM